MRSAPTVTAPPVRPASAPARLAARPARLAATAAALALVLASCSSTGGRAREEAEQAAAAGRCAEPRGTVAVVSHGTQGDPFWDVVKKGAEAAGQRDCLRVTYQGSGDAATQSQAIDNAVAQRVDGIVVSLANPGGLADSVTAATAAGIPVVTINAGAQDSAGFGAMAHIGQDDREAGVAAGARLRDAGATKALCVIHEAGHIGQEARCAGAEEGFGAPMTRLQVTVANLGEASSTIGTALAADPTLDGVLTLNSAVAGAAAQALPAPAGGAPADGAPVLGTFDLDADVVDLLTSGAVAFAVDQQPYLQGYLGVEFVALHMDNGAVVGGGQPVRTGPAIVDASTIETVAEFVRAGTR